MTGPGGVDDAVLTAVLCSLAGVRRGDAAAVVGSSPRLEAALRAASGEPLAADGEAAVVVAVRPHDVPLAVARLAPGGRLVALAADAGAARRVAAASGLAAPHIERVGGLVAWSARRPLGP